MMAKHLATDVLVIGGAGAGMRAALEAKAHGADVLIASKWPAGSTSSTLLAAGWLTRSTAESEDELFRQVVEVGGYLSNQRLVEVFAREAATVIPGLRDFGVDLSPVTTSRWGGPELPNLFSVAKVNDHPLGYGLQHPMRQATERAGVRLLDNVLVTRLLTNAGAVVGAVAVDVATSDVLVISAKSTVLATGGGAAAYERHNCAPGTTGDGYALAFRAGAELVDFECISFAFPPQRLKEIFALKDAPHEPFLSLGLCHYFLGGVRIDEQCRSTVPGLFAAGEVAGGVFGAARLGGSALADIYIFGARAGRFAAERAKSIPPPTRNDSEVRQELARVERVRDAGTSATDFCRRVKSTLWRYAGAMKTHASLQRGRDLLAEAQADLAHIRAHGPDGLRDALEAQHVLDVGRLIIASSLVRQETRGCFWRIDYPQPDNARWLRNVFLSGSMDNIQTRTEPVLMTRLRTPTAPPIGQGCFGYLPRK